MRTEITAARFALFATAALSAMAATPASAQQIDQIIAVGDSYADIGNAFALGYSNPGALQIYSTGRFSGGTNYIDTLSEILDVPVANFAIGGALAGTNNTLLCFDVPYGDSLCGKGFQYEVDQILGVGPQSAVFPAVDTAFDESDLLTISIGGNDARLYQQLGGTLALAPAAGAVTAAAATAQLNRLLVGGTPTISFIAGDTGRLPEIALNPAGAAVRSAFSASFNSAMQQTLAGYAANGSVVHYLDLGLVLDNIIANPAAYGITNGLVCPVLPNTSCVGNSKGYLFYLDGLHLTSDGFAIVGKYVATQLAAPLTLQAPADLAVDTGHQFGRTLQARLGGVGGSAGDESRGVRVFVVGDGFTANHGETRGNDRFENRGLGITGGVEFAIAGGAAGVAVNYSKPKSKFRNLAAEVDGDSVQLGVFGGMGFASGGFVKLQAGYGWDDYDIDRTGVVEGMEASPKGHHWIAAAKAGYLMPFGGVKVGPVAALDYAGAKVRGYTEVGDLALTLDVSSQSYKSLRGSLGLELQADLSENDSLRPYAAALVESELKGNSRSIHFAQTSAPVIVNSFDFESPSKRPYGRFNIGGTALLGANLTVDAGMSLTVGRKYGNETSGQVALNLGF
jgi:outer membrane lipase/esterase